SECFRRARALPAALCYVPREVQYKICKDPRPPPPPPPARAARATIEVRKGGCLRATGEEYCNGAGLWVKLSKVTRDRHRDPPGMPRPDGRDRTGCLCHLPAAGTSGLAPCRFGDQEMLGQVWGTWTSHPINTETLCRSVPPGWSYERDMELGRFLYDHSEKELQRADCTKEHINSIEVSSQAEDCAAAHLTDNLTYTFWESNGAPGQHWVRLNMKKGAIVKRLWLMLDGQASSYVPRRVAVYGGTPSRLHHLRTVQPMPRLSSKPCWLQQMQHRCSFLADQGYNVRLQGIKILSFWEWDLILNADMFQPARLVRYPLLEGVDADVLYRRAVLIQRFVQLLESVLCYLIPLSEDSIGTFNALRGMKPFLLLSKQSAALIAHCLQSSESTAPHSPPKLYINRLLAREHRANPTLDPSCRNTVFTQLYEGLRSSKNNQPLDYRWPQTYSQWWVCDFITEGIIDNGGGFRDSLSDVSEELCPSSGDVPVPLPFFVRTSNQANSSSDTRDMYVPNPSCKDFPKYEWIGQLMGAALRSKEFLILSLPALVWKQLAGEEVSWSKDFATVDSEQVKLLEMLEKVDKEGFEFMFGRELTYTTVLSDQRMVELIPNGSNTAVRYEDRKEFIRLVQKARLEESKEQIAAIRAGLLCVVPQPVLDLLTWQQMEKRICGDPEITAAELQKFIRFDDFSSDDTRVKYFLEALNNFTSEDLSRFLKFVTGRSRLPVQITVYPERSNMEALDLMPQACTCSCTFFLPHYSSAKVCEELLRYAVYNCMSIDTDKSEDDPWIE
uniref:HECT domain E3 ubiquitin protein ligase 3 n=1 Tax=Malurus cyaneus samueli TaxID=2593467 RepID=A0A8C5TV97_9PASS